MNPGLTVATTGRVLRQIRTDHRTIALIIGVPMVALGLLAWIYNNTPVFDAIGPALLGIFPLIVMFVVTSVATLRERQSGTLERLLTTRMGKADFMLGYAAAFGALAVVQALLATSFAIWVCDLDVLGPLWMLVLVAVLVAVLGTVARAARKCFRAHRVPGGAVHAGLHHPAVPALWPAHRPRPAPRLPQRVSDLLPLSYAVDAMKEVTAHAEVTSAGAWSIVIVVGFIVLALALASLTLSRRTP